MAIISRGVTPCALCGAVLARGDRVVATSHFVASPFDLFAPYSDVGFHQACFDAWPMRPGFIARYNRSAGRRTGQLMGADGRITPGPAVAEGEEGPLALLLPCAERRPGIHVMFNGLTGPAPETELVIGLRSASPGLDCDAVAERMRVGRLEDIKAMLRSGEHGLPLTVLAQAPAAIERAMGLPDPTLCWVAVSPAEEGREVLAPGAALAVCLLEGLEVTALRCWALAPG